jgi:hypothetical protein
VIELLGKDVVVAALAEGLEWDSPFGFRVQIDLEVVSLSSAGKLIFYWRLEEAVLWQSCLPLFLL